MIASKRSARGATASHCTRRTRSRFGRIVLGMPYIAFDVRPGTAERIAHFYREVMTRARRGPRERLTAVKRACRSAKSNIFISAKPTRRKSPTIATTRKSISRTSPGPHRRLKDLGLLTMEINELRIPLQ